MHRRSLLGLAALPLLVSQPVAALDAADGAIVLTLSGKLRNPNRGALAQFDMPMLERLPQLSYSTRTPWFTLARKFTGPLLRDVLAAAGAQGNQLRVSALNDYRIDIPMDDALRHDLLVARLLDDKPMSVRDKGPLFIIYPFDQNAALRNALNFSRCVWQLRSIEVL